MKLEDVTADMIGRTFDVGEFRVRLDLEDDHDVTPYEADCYTPAQVEDWRYGAWQYVGVVATAFLDGVELGNASLWGVEYGWMSDGPHVQIDLSVPDEYARDLTGEAIEDARATLARLVARAGAA